MNSDAKKILRLAAAFAAVIAVGFMIWQFGLLEPSVSSAKLNVDPQTFDFGEISMAKGNIAKTFLLKNDGEDPVKITDVKTSCMCTTAEIDGAHFGMHGNTGASITIPAKGSKEMLVTFDPNAHGPDAVGPISRVVMIKTNSETSPNVEVRVTGTVVK